MNPLSYTELRYKMGNSAKILGIVSVGLTLLSLSGASVLLSFGLGFMAILIAILSKGYENSLTKEAKTGIILGIIAIVVSVAMVAISVYIILSDPEKLKELQDIINALYGDAGLSADQSISDILGGIN